MLTEPGRPPREAADDDDDDDADDEEEGSREKLTERAGEGETRGAAALLAASS